MQFRSTRSLRRAYLEWVQAQVEAYKEAVSRTELLCLAEEAVEDLRGPRQECVALSEVLLCEAVDRRIFRRLRLPGYRVWCASHFAGHRPRRPMTESF